MSRISQTLRKIVRRFSRSREKDRDLLAQGRSIRRDIAMLEASLAIWVNEDSLTTPRAEDTGELIVSFTSTRRRLHSAALAAASLMQQQYRPHRVVLWLGEGDISPADLPRSLRRLEERGLEIRFCRDVGPHTKLLPALAEYPSAVIVTADDDVLYPRDWLSRLYSFHERHPDSIVCHRAHYITQGYELGPYGKWHWESRGSDLASPFRVFPTGVGGVLYPPGSLADTALAEELYSRLCPTADDIWFKAMSLLKGTPCRLLPAPLRQELEKDMFLVPGTAHQSLAATNVDGGGNDRQWRDTMAHFGLDSVIRGG